jgi:hypothetical protein
LRASAGSIDRYWRIAIGESRPENTVFSQRIAVSIDGKDVRIWQVVDNSWLTIEEWNNSAISEDFRSEDIAADGLRPNESD